MKTGLRILILFLFISPGFLKSQFYNWQWAKAAASPNNEKAWDVAYDKNSSSAYVAGSTEGGLGSVYGTLFSSTLGSKDGFVARYNSLGNVIWAFHIGSTSTDEIKSVCTDPFGNIYIGGTFQGIMDFDPGIGITNLIPNAASQDGFLAKYSSAGNLIWATKYGGAGTDDVWKIYADSNGVYACGSYVGSATFYSTNNTTKSTAAAQGQTNFVGAKYDTAGVIKWVVSGGSSKNDLALDVIADRNRVYFTGSYERDYTIYNAAGAASASLQILSSDKADAFVIAYNQDGSFAWATNAASQDVDEGHGIAQDGANIYIAGSFRNNTINFPYPAPVFSRTNKGGNDIFVASLSKSTGTWQWVSSQTGSDNDDEEAYEIDIDNIGNIVTTGYYRGNLDYSNYGGNNLSSSGAEDIFLTGFSKTNGNYLWSQRAGSNGSDIPHGITVTNIGEIYMAGVYSDNAAFGDTILPQNNGDNIFVAKTGCSNIGNNTIPATQTICASSSVAIIGSSPSGGAPGTYSFTWQESNNGSSWQPAAGTNSLQNYTPPALTADVYYRRLVSAAQVCNNPSASNQMFLRVNAVPSVANAGQDKAFCSGSVALEGTMPVVGTGSWSVIQGSISLSSVFSPTASVTAMSTPSAMARWTVKNGVCPATHDDVVITRFPPPSDAIACPDMVLEIPEAKISAVSPSVGTARWSVISGKGIIADPNNPVTTVTSLSEGINVVRWTVSSRGCNDNTDDVIVTLKELEIPNGFSPNNDNINDQFTITGIERYSSAKLCVYNRWGGLVYNNPQYKNTWKGTNMNNEPLADDTYYYTLEVPDRKSYTGFIILKTNK